MELPEPAGRCHVGSLITVPSLPLTTHSGPTPGFCLRNPGPGPESLPAICMGE